VDVHTLSDIDNQLDIGVVVVIGASGNFDVVVGHANVVGVGLEILRSGHDCEVDGPLVAENFVCPFSHRSNLLDGGNTVVGDQNLSKVKTLANRPRPQFRQLVEVFGTQALAVVLYSTTTDPRGEAHICDDGVAIILGHEVLDFARRSIGETVTANEMVGDLVTLGV
jgi:hypothetical protein